MHGRVQRAEPAQRGLPGHARAAGQDGLEDGDVEPLQRLDRPAGHRRAIRVDAAHGKAHRADQHVHARALTGGTPAPGHVLQRGRQTLPPALGGASGRVIPLVFKGVREDGQDVGTGGLGRTHQRVDRGGVAGEQVGPVEEDPQRGAIRLVTVSPEWPGVSGYIEALVRDGVVVSIGHTKATTDQIADAIDAGAPTQPAAVAVRHPMALFDAVVSGRGAVASVPRLAPEAGGTDNIIPIGCVPVGAPAPRQPRLERRGRFGITDDCGRRGTDGCRFKRRIDFA